MTSDSGFFHSASGQMLIVGVIAVAIILVAWKYVF